MKQVWRNEYEYKRILEILKSYWLTEPEEEYAEVNMYFRHKDGREQWKDIIWINPHINNARLSEEKPKLQLRSFADIERKCKTCLYHSDHGCTTWDCKYINRDELIEALIKER